MVYPLGSKFFNVCKKKSTLFSKQEGYQWDSLSTEQSAKAQEIAPLLIEFIGRHRNETFNEKHFEKCITKFEKLLATQSNRSKSLKLSLQDFVDNEYTTIISRTTLISFSIQILQALINKGYNVAFNFSEVFLIKDQELLPAHFRKAEDYWVQNEEEYHEIISKLGYQFAKGMFNKFCPKVDSHSSQAETLIASHYSSIKPHHERQIADLALPLITLPCFQSAYEARTYYDTCVWDYTCIKNGNSISVKQYLILSFNSPNPLKELTEVLYWYNSFSEKYYSEVIVIIQDQAYAEIEEREKLSKALNEKIHESQYKKFFHILLLTQDPSSLKPTDTLFSLAPPKTLNESFSPLANNAGYYFCDPEFFRALSQNFNQDAAENYTPDWLQQALTYPQTAAPEEEKLSGYIYGQEPREKVRQSKFSTKNDLKSQIGMTFKYHLALQQETQHEVKQSQALKQDLAKEQSLTQQRQQELDEQVDFPLFTPPLPISLFFLNLNSTAENQLKTISPQQQMQQEIYYTSWYRQNFSQLATLKKMVRSEGDFLADQVAKIFGLGYSVSSEMESLATMEKSGTSIVDVAKHANNMFKIAASQNPLHYVGRYLMTPLPGYSAESIEAYLQDSIFYRIGDFSDGINPACRHQGYSRVLRTNLMQGWDNLSTALEPMSHDPLTHFSAQISQLSLFANREKQGYQSHFSTPTQDFGLGSRDKNSVDDFLSLLSTVFWTNQYELHCLAKLPSNPQLHKNTYIYLNSPKSLYYIDENGEVLDSKLSTYQPLLEGLSKTKAIAKGVYRLNSTQIELWISSKKGISAPDRFKDPLYIESMEDTFLAVISLVFPEYEAIVNKLFANFDEHNVDNIRILLQLLTSVGQDNFALFLEYLTTLDRKCLLKHFSKIYFSYAPTAFSLVELFKTAQPKTIPISHSNYGQGIKYKWAYQNENDKLCFHFLAQRTPFANSVEDWPFFEQFAHAVLVFAAKNYIYTNSNSLKLIEEFWQRMAAKILIYCEGDSEQQRQLIELFLSKLMDEDGLKLAQLRKLDTLFICLEKLLDHAIEKHNLREQIAELEDLSLAWTDVPYAIEYNGFGLVSKEMKIEAGLIGKSKNSYIVSLSEFRQAIGKFNATSPSLMTSAFRYLGKESFRENLDFYRRLYPRQCANPQEQRIYELIWAYYVAAFTGINYDSHPEEVEFIKQCHRYLEQHPYAQSLENDKVLCISRFLQNLYQTETGAQQGTMTLWVLWQEHKLAFVLPSDHSIPDILASKFDRKKLKEFLLTHQKELKAILPTLLSTTRLKSSRKRLEPAQADRLLAQSLFYGFFDKNDDKALIGWQLITILQPNFGMSYYLENLLEILVLVESLRQLNNADAGFFAELQIIAEKTKDIKVVISLLKLANEKLENHPERLKSFTLFLQGLAGYPELISYCIGLTPELELIVDYCLDSAIDEKSLPILFGLSQSLEGDTETLKALLELMCDEKVSAFFHNNAQEKLPALLLQQATKLIHKTNNLPAVLAIVEEILQEKEQDKSYPILDELLNFDANKSSSILLLANEIHQQHHHESFTALFGLLRATPENCLQTLVYLYKHYSIPIAQLKEVLQAPSLPEALDSLEEALYQQDLPNYGYDIQDIKAKIGQIKYNSWDDNPAKPLSDAAQKSLKRDYKKMMAYIENQPVYTEYREGVAQSYTVHQLKHRHFSIVFRGLQQRISRGENKKENQLALLALCSVALKRTTKKFPRSTQILPLIHSLGEENPLVQELKTGAGKSIMAALHAVISVSAGKTPLIPTENEKLALDGIVNFRDFYRYLGISCGERIIEAHSPFTDYVVNGVNYSTPYGLSLFFISMALQKVRLVKNRDLIWDEIDASLTSTVPFRLAATLDPILLDTKSWTKIYAYMLEFVQEKEIYLDNACLKEDDIQNFRVYCLLKATDKGLTEFLKQIPDPLFDTLLNSARLAVQLEENKDYMVVEKEEQGGKHWYAAPVLPHTSRAEPRASFGAGAQPLLHTDKNSALSSEVATRFSILPDTETIIHQNPKNLVDLIRAEGGSLLGITATPGMRDQLNDFRNQHGISSVFYPSFHPDCSLDLGILGAEGWAEQKALAIEQIELARAERNNQPVLVICESAQAATDLCSYISSAAYPWQTQSYYGYSQKSHEEERFIAEAGKADRVSISTKCESRGADFDSDHPDGLLVINLCTHLTEEELVQIKGRSGRNGKPGQFCSIVDLKQLNLEKSASAEEVAARFKAHQQNLCLKAQQDRARTRFLDDARNCITWKLLKLRQKTDKILSRQHGRDYSIVPTIEFMKVLRDLNKKAETHYFELLKIYEEPNEEMKDLFLNYLTKEYNQVVEKWLPDETFGQYQAVEPPIPLQNVNTLKGINKLLIKDLLAISELLAMGWEVLGHQPANSVLNKVEHLMEALDQCGSKQGGIKTLIGQYLAEFDLVKIPELISKMETIETSCLNLIEEIPPAAEGWISKEKALDFVRNYFTTIKTAILEGRWEDLEPPSFPEEIFSAEDKSSSFMAKISKTGFKIGGKVGVYAFINFYLLPKIMKFTEDLIKEWVPNDRAKQLQLMKLLKDLKPELKNLLLSIPNDIQTKEGIVSLVLNKLLPILEHSSIKEAALLLDNDAGKLPQALAMFIKALELNKPQSLNEFFSCKTLLPLIKMATELNLVQLAVKDPQFKEILNQFSSLEEESLVAFYQFDFKSLFKLLHLLAHPEFYHFLKELPEEASFGHLKFWLNQDSDTAKIPASVNRALQTLMAFQDNRKNLEARDDLKIQGLKAKFSLSPEKLQRELQALVPVLPVEPPPITAPVSEPKSLPLQVLAWIAAHKVQSLIVLAVSILLCWIIIPVIIISAIICAAILLWQKIATLMEGTKTIEKPAESYIEPIILDLSQMEHQQECVPDLLDEELEQVDLKISSRETESANDDELTTELCQEELKVMGQCAYPKGRKGQGLYVNGNGLVHSELSVKAQAIAEFSDRSCSNSIT